MLLYSIPEVCRLFTSPILHIPQDLASSLEVFVIVQVSTRHTDLIPLNGLWVLVRELLLEFRLVIHPKEHGCD